MIQSIVNKQKEYFKTGITKSYRFRMDALARLKQGVLDSALEINLALKQDLNKSELESYMSEIGIVVTEINYALKRLRSWMKPQYKKTPMPLFLARSYISAEPMGVTLILSPWNYPFQLAIVPLIGAIAAGNTVVLKPASYAEKTSLIIDKLLSTCFPEEYVKTILGGREENTLLLEQPFDYIFFTGSTNVGKMVLEKASKFLTPVTLELGGKSPCIIDQSVNMDLVAKRIAFGKFLNAGQTCVAPDYVFIREEQHDAFITSLKKALHSFFGENPLNHQDYPKIINRKHHMRLVEMLQDGKIDIGGSYNETSIEPTIISNIHPGSKILEEEIFGPILPVLFYKDIEEVFSFVSKKPKPLALYLFSNNKSLQKEILNRLSFGGATINDTVMHFGSTEIGFGGVGNSGFGRYHGKYSFDTFSNLRSILNRSNLVDLQMRYHPYTKRKLAFLKRFMR